ncbi:MAG: ABC transporter ATP-binding protein, partial [Rhodospirillales bacterium]
MSLAAENLAFGFGARFVGRDVTLALAEGTVLCLLGPNGGGKTTLFRTLLGLIPPLAGRVTLDGTDIKRLTRADIARRVGYVPQAQPGYFPYTVEEMVLMGRTAHLGLFARPSEADRQAAHAALTRLGIAHLADRIYTQISGGERQLTLFARAL